MVLDVHQTFHTMREYHDHYQICKSSLKCTKCDQIFDKLCTYHGHVNICDGLDKFKCSGCGLCFLIKRRVIIIHTIVEKNWHVKGVVCHFVIRNHY